jgi:ubiquitin C-terminal hydrolase
MSLKNNKQYDAQECLLYLFDRLEAEQTPSYIGEFNPTKHNDGVEAWSNYIQDHSTILSTFSGMFMSKIKCEECSNVSKTFNLFNNIFLSCKEASLEKAYEKEFFKKEKLKGK